MQGVGVWVGRVVAALRALVGKLEAPCSGKEKDSDAPWLPAEGIVPEVLQL